MTRPTRPTEPRRGRSSRYPLSTGKVTLTSLTAAVLAVSGCQSKNTSSPPRDQLHVDKQTPTSQPSANPSPDIDSAHALTAKTEAWAKEMQSLMSKKPILRPGAAGEPSVVDFMEPDAFSIGLPQRGNGTAKSEPPVTVVPISNPVVQATPSDANRGATLQAQQPEKQPRTTVATNTNSGAGVPPLLADGGFEKAGQPAKPADTSINAGDLELSLTKQLGHNKNDLWAHLDFQLLQFLKDKPTPQLDTLAKLPTEDRELVASVMDGLTNFRNALRADNNMLMSRKVKPLLELADRVRAQADLTIPAIALCTKVDGFGVYEPIEPARFTAMKEHPVIVYCEVENFASHQNEKKLWETKLSQEVVLYTETGLPVWQDKTQSIPDLARRRRHDFFIVKKTKLPDNVAIGRYLLKVTIVDQQANRVAEATVPVQFVAQ
jgi:hypothetical protein